MSKAKKKAIPGNLETLHKEAMAFIQDEDYAKGLEWLEQGDRLSPNNPAIIANIGYCYLKTDRAEEALKKFNRTLELKPNWHVALYNKGLALHALERFDEASETFQKGVDFQPDHLEAKLNIASINLEQDKVQDAIDLLHEILDQRPDYLEAKINLSKAYNIEGKHRDALRVLDSFEDDQLFDPDICIELAKVFDNLGQRFRCLPLLNKALESDSLTIANKCDIGHLMIALRCYQTAEDMARQVLEDEPESQLALRILNTALTSQGRVDEGIEIGMKCFEIDPNYLGVYLSLIFGLNYANPPRQDLMNKVTASFAERVVHFGPTLPPYHYTGAKEPNKRLKVGFFSPDYREHSCAYFIEAVFAELDREQFEVIAIPVHGFSDRTTAKLRRLADQWVPAYGQLFEPTVEKVRDLNLDIAIDLAGHTSNNCLGMMSKRVAPVQINWLGYPNTTGLHQMDYRIVDHDTDPVGINRVGYTEELIRLERCFLCFTPQANLPPVEDKSDRDHIIFGSFNAIAKVNNQVLDCWIEILRNVPNSSLMIKALQFGEDDLVNRVKQRFIKQGVDPDRLQIFGAMHSSFDHLNLYNEIDIGLDSFPYHGTTTTCEAASMGVPVVTVEGEIHSARVGISLMKTLGLSELIATDPEDYVQRAAALGSDVPRLRQIQATMRERLQSSPLMDRADFNKHFGNALRQTWLDYCKTGVSLGDQKHKVV